MLLSRLIVLAFCAIIDYNLPAEPAEKTCTVIDDTVHIPQKD